MIVTPKHPTIEKVIIMGAAGRDFHNFNVCFRNNPRYRVVAFTATQIPDIDNRSYPSQLCGDGYPNGIPIYSSDHIVELIQTNLINLVVFSYSDVTHHEVMHQASRVTAAGADFIMLGAYRTMLKSKRPVISVCAIRTGCGKSQTSRHIIQIIQKMGKRVVSVRHPMPYGDLSQQIVQRFASRNDIKEQHCTIEEREEYEPFVDMGAIVYAGVDYELILNEAEKEADVIVWDGGNNDTPFFKPDLNIVVFDPHRAGHETFYHPGESNLLMADIAIINKVDSATYENVEQVQKTIIKHNPKAKIILAESEVWVDNPQKIKGKRVLVVEDGPTLTHGEMTYGAGVIAAQRFGAATLVDPRPYLKGSLKTLFKTYRHIGKLLPAMGYGPAQISELEMVINNCPCDLVLSATPIDLTGVIRVNKPVERVYYSYCDNSNPTLEEVVCQKLKILLN